jgi:hypothetical protein
MVTLLTFGHYPDSRLSITQPIRAVASGVAPHASVVTASLRAFHPIWSFHMTVVYGPQRQDYAQHTAPHLLCLMTAWLYHAGHNLQ